MRKIMQFLMLSCKRSAELVNKKLNDKLSFVETFRLKLHVGMCKVCEKFDHQQTIIDEALKNLEKPSEKPSSDLKDRIKNTIKHFDD